MPERLGNHLPSRSTPEPTPIIRLPANTLGAPGLRDGKALPVRLPRRLTAENSKQNRLQYRTGSRIYPSSSGHRDCERRGRPSIEGPIENPRALQDVKQLDHGRQASLGLPGRGNSLVIGNAK